MHKHMALKQRWKNVKNIWEESNDNIEINKSKVKTISIPELTKLIDTVKVRKPQRLRSHEYKKENSVEAWRKRLETDSIRKQGLEAVIRHEMFGTVYKSSGGR